MSKRSISRLKKPTELTVVCGVAWYRAEQWERLREISVDRDDLETTYEEWECSAEKALQEIRRGGAQPQKVDVDVEELLAWWRVRNLALDGQARAMYAAEKLSGSMRSAQE